MRSKLTVALIVLTVVGGTSFLLTGCNTVAGAGKDVSKAGSTVTDAANKNK